MANFQTHIAASAGISMVLGTVLYGAHMVNAPQAVSLIVLGSIGGVLPDIDADQSKALRMVFQLLSAVVAFFIMFKLLNKTGVLFGLIMWGFIFAGIRFSLCHYFCELTKHRGIFHSLPMGAVFGFAITAIAYHWLHLTISVAWFAGIFLFLGYAIHLIIDEGGGFRDPKRAFKNFFVSIGKLLGFGNWYTFFAVYIIAVVLFFFTPSIKEFYNQVFLHAVWMKISNSIMPVV